jgi:uncharacterized protein (UPF0335 family)
MELDENTFELKRLSEHYKRIEEQMKGLLSDVHDIKKSILGSEFGDEGISKQLKIMKQEMDDLKEEQIKSKIYFNQFKWLVSIVGSAILVLLVKQIFAP